MSIQQNLRTHPSSQVSVPVLGMSWIRARVVHVYESLLCAMVSTQRKSMHRDYAVTVMYSGHVYITD